MDQKMSHEDAMAAIKQILTSVNEAKGETAFDVNAVDEETDLSEIGLDSLDLISFWFELEQATGRKVPDDVYGDKEMLVIKNLADYLSE